jgi:hypothetical protein
MTITEYWIVHSPHAMAVKSQHATLRAAQEEARRLSVLHPGATFAVLEIVDGYCTPAGGARRLAVARTGGEQ